ncbi:MAG: Crp/Fnr family transcriptional regulator [Salinivirgaceae bacterium]
MHQNPLISALLQLSALTDASITALESLITFKKQAKNSVLLSMGSIAKNIFFLHKGLARVFYYRDDRDVTDYFAVGNQFVGATASLFKGIPSNKAIELLEDSEVYSLPYARFDQLCLKHPDLERAVRKLAIFGLLEEQERIESLRFLSAKERYWELEKKYPGITNRAPLKHIASYLNTTDVSISRIRAGKQ